MAFHVIAHLVTHPRREGELAAVLQRRMQFPLKTQQHVPTPAPVIGQIAGVYSTMRTRVLPKWQVRHRALPVTPG